MNTYIVLIRGINVGGKNAVSMAILCTCLEGVGYEDVSTYIASGNVLLRSDKKPEEVKHEIEELLPQRFSLDSELVKVLVLTHEQLRAVVANKPSGFGDQPTKYHSDAIFLIDITTSDAMLVFDPRDGVDKVWVGDGVVYSQRLSAERTRSRLNKIIGTSAYRSMTIRSWNTVVKLLALIDQRDASHSKER